MLWSMGSRHVGPAVVAHGPSRSAARGIFPDQGSNPCPPHQQADSQPLRHQGSPDVSLNTFLFTLTSPSICTSSILMLYDSIYKSLPHYGLHFFFFGCGQAFFSCGEWGLWCTGFSLRWLLLLRSTGSSAQASVVAAHRLSTCGTRALERTGFSSCGAWAQ